MDTLVRMGDGSVKLLVYRENTYTNQYLDFNLQHFLYQKMGVVRTLMNKCDKIVLNEADRRKEKETIKESVNYVATQSGL